MAILPSLRSKPLRKLTPTVQRAQDQPVPPRGGDPPVHLRGGRVRAVRFDAWTGLAALDRLYSNLEGSPASPRCETVIDGERTPVGPNDLVFVKIGTRHNFINTVEAPLRLVTTYAPPTRPTQPTPQKPKPSLPRTTSSREPLACRLSVQIPVHHAPERNVKAEIRSAHAGWI